MKRSVKILVSALLLASMSLTMVPAVIPAVQQTASAASNVSLVGRLENGFEWSWDESTGTVTIEGEGLLPANLSRMVSVTGSSPDTLILGDGITGFSDNTTALSPGTLVLGAKFADTDFTSIKPAESFEVSRQNGNFLAYDGGLYSVNGQTLYSYAAGDKNVTLRNGTRTVGDYAFYGCEAESIVIPETVTAISSDAFDNLASTGGIPIILPTDTISLGYAPNGFSSNDLEPYKLVFIFRRGDELVCETTDTRQDIGPLIAEAWNKIGCRTPEEVYSGESTTAYGFRDVTAVKRKGSTQTIWLSTFFVTRNGIQSGWVYNNGKVYYIQLEEHPQLIQAEGKFYYNSSSGGTKSKIFTFSSDGSLIDPPSDMMVVTTDGTKSSYSSLTGGGSEPGSDSGSSSGSTSGYRGLVYRGGKAYIYDDRGEMLHSGWFQAEGDWFYLNDYGAGVVKCWRNGEDGSPRYLKADGTMAHDEWIEDYHNWYYLDSDGRKYTGRHRIDGRWYTFDSNGVLQTSGSGSGSTTASYTVRYDENGKARIYDRNGNQVRSGWYEVDDEWYCINDYGAGVVKCWRDGIDGQPRYLKADGTMATNEWIQDYGNWYYLLSDGTRAKPTVTLDGKTYHFDLDGAWRDVDGVGSPVSPSTGSGSTTGYTVRYDENGKARIYDRNGNQVRSGWYQADGKWYCINDYGAGVVKCWRLRDGKYRYLKADGSMAANEWVLDYNYWYYCKSDGSRYESSWAQIGGKRYWFGGSGKMMADGWLTLADGNTYYFYADGHMAANTTIDGHRVNGSGVRVP